MKRGVLGGVLAVGLVAWGCDPVEPAPQGRRRIELVTHPVANRAPANVPWVAFQDGTRGAWTVLRGDEGRYAFDLQDGDGRYGVAVVCTRDTGSTVRGYLLHATSEELPRLQVRCPYAKPIDGGHALSGRLSGFEGASSVTVTMPGVVLPSETVEEEPDYEVTGPSGEQRLMALRMRDAEGIFTDWVDRVLVRPVRLEAATRLDLDLEREGQPTEVHRVSVQGLAGESLLQETRLHHPANSVRAVDPLAGRRWWGATPFHDYGGIPLALQSAEDVHVSYAEAYVPGQNRGRSVERYFKAPGDVTLELPPAFESVRWSVRGAGPDARFEARWERATGDVSWYTLSLWDEPARTRQWHALVTPGWLGEGAGWTYTLPSFEGQEGWRAGWSLAPGTRVLGLGVALYANRPLAEAMRLQDANAPGPEADGFELRSASSGMLLEGTELPRP